MNKKYRSAFYALLLLFSTTSVAFHLMDSPTYSSEAMVVEKTIGNYDVTFELSPTFIDENSISVISLHISQIDTGYTLDKSVTFSIFDDYIFFTSPVKELGIQQLNDGFYQQKFSMTKQGNYIIRAQFDELGEAFILDLPIKVGNGNPLQVIGISISIIITFLFFVNVLRRKHSRINPKKA